VVNLKPNFIQRILDYDYLIGREPSVVSIVHRTDTLHKAFYGSEEFMIPVYKDMKRALEAHNPEVVLNLASFRSAYLPTKLALEHPSVRVVVIVAEGIPERQMKELIALAKKHNKTIIGPATFGALTVGALRAGVVGGDTNNLIKSRLYAPGSVGLVTRSGGLLNEMFRMIARASDGVNEGVAIGGDVFPGSTMLEHIMRFEQNPEIKLIVALSEIGGKEEYEIARLKKEGKIKKPLIMWVAGASAELFPWQVQFGHAAAKAGSEKEKALAKMEALREAGVLVPHTFSELENLIREESERLGLKPKDVPYNKPPLDFAKAKAQGLVRRPTSIVSSISWEKEGEITYNGVPLSRIIEEKSNIGRVIGLLWFKKDLPEDFQRFLELALIVLADHGPHVSGAHNAIVAARAGKDIISSLASGLLTIGPRFGGAIDDAVRYFKDAHDRGLSPREFVEEMKRQGKLIPGIGHRVKSKHNPDKRVELIKRFVFENIPDPRYLKYALAVEEETLKKSDNLILNVDGAIGASFLDMLYYSGFTEEEIKEIVEIGYVNGLFAIARSIGMVGHILDQKRLKQPLYRHPNDDIYVLK